MKSVNKTILVGHLGQEPEVKQLEGGRALARFSVATNERWRDQATGEGKERTEWHRVVVFGKTAELVGQYLGKGSLVFVEGRLQTSKWRDKEGHDRYTTEIVADQVTFLDRKATTESKTDPARSAA